jgi:hypothetical protein
MPEDSNVVETISKCVPWNKGKIVDGFPAADLARRNVPPWPSTIARLMARPIPCPNPLS